MTLEQSVKVFDQVEHRTHLACQEEEGAGEWCVKFAAGGRPAAFALCRAQRVARWWAARFAALRLDGVAEKGVRFAACAAVELRESGAWGVVEAMLQGRWVKHTSNDGQVFTADAALPAFSHFTHAASGGDVLVCDLR
eukprot:gene1905-3024_t